MKNGSVLLIVLLVSALFQCVALAEECKVSSINKISEGTYEIVIDPAPFLSPGFTGEWFFLEGPIAYQGTARPIEPKGDMVVATLYGRESGDQIQFSVGRGEGLWVIPGCPEEKKDSHFTVTLPPDSSVSNQNSAMPAINGLLLKD